MKTGNKFAAVLVLGGAAVFACGECRAEEALEPIVVHRPLPEASTWISADEIRARGARTPEDILAALGVDVQERGAAGAKADLSLQASTFQQVLILINGVRVKDSQTSHHDLDLPFNVEDIERVEILPAPAAVKYGTDGLGGAVNFVLKPSAADRRTFRAAGGANDTFETSLSLPYAYGRFRNSASASFARTDGARFDADARSNTFFHALTREEGGVSLFLDTGYNEKEFGAYDFYTPGRGYPSKEWTNTSFISGRAEVRHGDFTWEPRASFRRHHDKFALTVLNPALYLNHHRTDTVEVGQRLTRSFERWDMAIGMDYGEEHLSSSNLKKRSRSRWSALLDPTWHADPATSLNVTARIDSYSTFNEEATGSATLRHAFGDDADAYVTLGRVMRVPTFTELYYSDPTTDGDPSLEPEHAFVAEVGGRRRFTPGLEGGISLFARRETDTIDYVKRTPADPKFVARNISRAVTFGAAFSARWQAAPGLALDGRYSFAHKDLDDDGLIYKYGYAYVKHGATLGLETVLPFGKNRAEIAVTKKPVRHAWVLVNDVLSWDVGRGRRLFVEGYNIFGQEYQDIEGIPVEGRIWKIGLELTW